MTLAPNDPVARQAAQRRACSQLAADARRYAARLVDTDGEEAVETLELRGLLRSLGDAGFPSGESSARLAWDGFTRTLRALLTAERPRRRAILAGAVLSFSQAIDELVVDTQETEALTWRARTAEG